MGIPGLYLVYRDSRTWPEMFGKQSGGSIGILSANGTGTLLFYAHPRNYFRWLGSWKTLFILSI